MAAASAAEAQGVPPAAATNDEPIDFVTEYLERIHLPGWSRGDAPPPLSAETLRLLHRCHCLAVPFENLSFIHHSMKAATRPVDVVSLHKRIVRSGRGGMCQEMNALHHHILKLLGFECYTGMAMVVTGGPYPPETPLAAGALPSSTNLGTRIDCLGTHQIIFARAGGGEYLVDVGFGGQGLLEPILLRAYDDAGPHDGDAQREVLQGEADALAAGCAGESHQGGSRFRLRRGVAGSAEPLPCGQADSHPERDSFVCWYLQIYLSGAWTDLYAFTRTYVAQTVHAACAEQSFRTHPLFTRSLIVSQPTLNGRRTLTDWTLKERIAGEPTRVTQLSSDEERDKLLATLFGIRMF